MATPIITIDNFGDLNKEVENLQNLASLAGACFGGHVYITGEKAIERFLKEYAPAAKIEKARDIKTDGKTSAEILPYIMVNIEGDSRREKGIVCSDCYYNIFSIIKYNGEYYELLRQYNENTGSIALHNDPFQEELRPYLPYGWEKSNPAPNKVGTITDAKLNEWIKWLNKRRGVAQAICNERTAGVQAFMARINQMDPTQYDKFKISANEGTIVKNGLEYKFIFEEGGHIHQQIKVHYSAHNDLDTFLKMIAGTFTTSEKIYWTI